MTQVDVYNLAERAFAMSDSVWRRHANPLSGLTRLWTCLPLLVLAIWSRVWFGWWALPLTALALLWIWLNPRVFPEPQDFKSWMSRAVFGERVWIDHRHDLPDHHQRMVHVLTWLSLPGAVVMIIGLVFLWWDWTLFGMAMTMVPKVWFCDRMVWILDDWLRAGGEVPGVRRDEL